MPEYQIFCIIRQYLEWPKYLKVISVTASTLGLHNKSEEYSIWLSPSVVGSLKFCSQTSNGRRLVSCYCFIKDLAVSVIIGPVTGFPSDNTTVNHVYITLSNCANLDSFSVCCLQRPSHSHLIPQTVITGPSVSLHHEQLPSQCWMKPLPHSGHFQVS
jgi:hypothetical protein